MANNYKHIRTNQDSIHVRGVLSDDAKEITFLNKDKEEVTINVYDCLKNYVGEEIAFAVSVKEEMEIDD